MRVIARGTLRTFWEQYPDSELALETWYYEAKHAEWHNSAEVKKKYGNASIVGNNRVVFNICGNKYRLITEINYAYQKIYIRFVGTHKAYNNVDAETV